MKVKQKSSKGKESSVLRGPHIIKKMKTPSKKVGDLKIKKSIQKIAENSMLSKVDVTRNKKTKQTGSKLGKKEEPRLKTLDVSTPMIQLVVKTLMELQEEHQKNSKQILFNDKDSVYLQLSFIKKPEVPEQRRKYVKLQHTLYGSDPEVCLFVSDYKKADKIKKTPDEKIDSSVEHYTELLKLHGVEGITTIMPSTQLRNEYSSYESKKKLVDRFDLFLCQSNLWDNAKFIRKIGNAFTKKNKVPVSLKFPANLKVPDPKFNERVNALIHSSWYVLKPHSDTVSLRIGNVSHSQEQICENISSVLHQLTEDASQEALPGGINNLKSIMVKTSRSKALPIYISLAKASSVATPVLKSVRPEGEVVEDELSTQPGKRVAVLPTGHVLVTDDHDSATLSDEDSDEELGREDEDEVPEDKSSEDEAQPPPKKQKTAVPKALKKDDSDESESEEETEKAEQHYLRAWSRSNENGSSGAATKETTKTKSKPANKNKIAQLKKKTVKAQKSPQTKEIKRKEKTGKGQGKKSPKTKENKKTVIKIGSPATKDLSKKRAANGVKSRKPRQKV